jgi:choline-sulfatase
VEFEDLMAIAKKSIGLRSFQVAAIALASTAVVSSAFAVEGAAEHPNVLMICIDDLNDWVGCLGGHPDVKTPHMDRLAERGRNFANAHCVVPVCSPSRVSIMSGVHATTHGSYDLGPSYQSIKRLDDVPCMQAYFKENGYLTIAGGKVLHHGFTGYLKSAIDVSLAGRGGPRPKQRMNWPGGSWDWGPFPASDDQMGDCQLAENAAEALQKTYERPFFMSVGIFRPHVPMFVPQKWFDLYEREKITLPKAPLADLDDIPPNFKRRLNIEPTHAEVLEKGDWRGMVHAYLACVSFADMCVGTVLEGLNAGPNADNTFVVLWSDHGFHLGEKQHWAKRTLWEESTRTPLMIAGPGIRPGDDCREAVSLLDIYPTLIDLCGLPANTHLEGVSLLPQLKDPRSPRGKPVLSTSYYENHAIRTKDWRYIRYADGAEELYDHRTDSDEFHNLANDPRHNEVKQSLAKWLPKDAAPEVKRRGVSNQRHVPSHDDVQR